MSEQRTGTDRRAATHEPAPTGNGPIVLEFAIERATKSASLFRSHGHHAVADSYNRVIGALRARAEMGKAKYGTYLRAYNGRSAVVDLIQELLDAIMYAEQCALELQSDFGRQDLLVGSGMLEQLYSMAGRLIVVIPE